MALNNPILITGKRGGVAKSLQRCLSTHNLPFVALGQREMDITNKKKVMEVIGQWKPSIIIHTAAMTDVDRGENEFQRMIEINLHGTKNILDGARTFSSSIMYVSSDFVFDGKKKVPYDSADRPTPINQYGYTKWLGEEYVRRYPGLWWIVRTSSLFGGGAGFVDFVAHKGRKGEKIMVVEDQVSSPTYIEDLSKDLLNLLEQPAGIYHVTNRGECSKFELAQFIYEKVGAPMKLVTAITSKEWNAPASRPSYSTLQPNVVVQRHWKEAVEEYLVRRGWLDD
ncbi:dTDP-4-dehydrorhamnose reductase [Evansella vedderi]|uniref:dTDP-4-dehydrorhamnose reductase n=1 Tax=Evansella vedderi TaxID=38282 RepID=A0ABT9ZVV7_9BACI|nr:dTDP-4-dehydrorhamnose reductase [Evansella vedderi]MDQ0255375.1 dTDP-4-dehydrorhamnose reductase [Evansella vedderi]